MKRMAKPNMPAPASEQGRPASLHELVTTPAAQNTAALEPWTVFGDCDLAKMAAELREQTRQVTQAGDMQAPEAMLYGQAVALQTIFTSLSRRGRAERGRIHGRDRALFAPGAQGAGAVPGDAFLAPRPGLEPGTYGLTVRRSTN
jgi:hypothetical protein